VISSGLGSGTPSSRFVAPGHNVAGVFFWAVVSDESDRVIEFFPTHCQAERMLAEALQDEPDWRGILRVEKIEFRTGMAN
jgi:hypothetical protein